MIILVVFAVVLAALAWFFLSGRDDAPEPTARRSTSSDINYSELEQAEREVREAPDTDNVQDWGPGSGPPPKPPIIG